MSLRLASSIRPPIPSLLCFPQNPALHRPAISFLSYAKRLQFIFNSLNVFLLHVCAKIVAYIMTSATPDSEMSEQHADRETQSINYERFCRRVGIWPVTAHPTSYSEIGRPAKNKGTYGRLVHALEKCRLEYYTTASLINIALFSQIIIAAAVTAVSAANGPGVAITVLGAINTILAGSLTWVKGQGLPDRLLSYANELRRVREHIEDLERRYESSHDFRLDVEAEAKRIYAMYDNARKNAENAYAGTFQRISNDAMKGDWRMVKDRPAAPDGGATETARHTLQTAGSIDEAPVPGRHEQKA